MMEVLKFLTECQKDINDFINSFDEDSCDEDLHNAKLTRIKISNGIKELQDLKDLDKKSCNDCYYLKSISDNKYKCTNGNSYVNDILTGYANHHLTFRCRFFSKKLESKDA